MDFYKKSIIIFIAMELLNVSYIMKTFEISSNLFAYTHDSFGRTILSIMLATNYMKKCFDNEILITL